MLHSYLPGVLEKCAQVRTPSGGLHIYFRHLAGPVPGNQKLARDPNKKTLIETRGEGGYTIAPGSPASTHPSGEIYLANFEAFAHIQPLDEETISVMYALAISLDQTPPQDADPRQSVTSATDSPGNNYSQCKTNEQIAQLLQSHGWTITRRRSSGVIELRRPGKTAGISATVGHDGEGCLHVFSSNAQPFETGRKYDPFGVYARLEHGGNFSEAARELGRNGYGQQHATKSTDTQAQRTQRGGGADKNRFRHRFSAR
jgi:hypothetical protein